jgi:hypothetical protein
MTPHDPPRVVHLDLSGSSSLSDLAPLSACCGLRVLKLADCGEVRSLEPLVRRRESSTTKGTEAVEGMSHSRGGDDEHGGQYWSPLHLEQLVLSRCDNLEDLRPLASFSTLRRLDLAGCKKVGED